MPTELSTSDLPETSSCRHVIVEQVLDAVHQFWTTNPTVAERSITRLEAIRNRIANAAGIDVSLVTNRMVARAVIAHIERRFGGSDA